MVEDGGLTVPLGLVPPLVFCETIGGGLGFEIAIGVIAVGA